MKNTTILLAALWLLAFFCSGAQADCCRRTKSVSYTVGSGRCKDAGGGASSSISTCTITICADGKRLVGSYCGQLSCNLFGCNCGGGCLKGNWEKSFIENYPRNKIRVLSTKWN